MSQSDLLGAVPVSSGLNVRVNLNAADAALATDSEGSGAPTQTWPHMAWRHHAAGLRYRRNASNTAWLIEENYGAAGDPTADDDESAGYAGGSRWVNASAKRVFVCADPESGAARWVPLATVSRATAPPAITNNATDPNNDLDIEAGTCLADEGVPITLGAGLTKRLDAAWAAGTNHGGLDTGSKTTDTWYAVFVIAKADGTADVLLSTSGTARAMPTGYVYKRRIGWRRTDGNGNLLPVVQDGDRFWWVSPIQDIAGASCTTTAALVVISVPPSTIAQVHAHPYSTAANYYVLLSCPDAADVAVSATVFNAKGTASQWLSNEVEVKADSSSRIRYGSSAASGLNLNLETLGWIDTRGRDD